MTERICFLQWPKGDGASPPKQGIWRMEDQWKTSYGHPDLQHRQLYEAEEKARYKEFDKMDADQRSVTGGTAI